MADPYASFSSPLPQQQAQQNDPYAAFSSPVQQPAAAQDAQQQESMLKRAGKFYLNYMSPAPLTEAAANLVTGMLSTPVAGLAGIATGGNADVVNKLADVTYKPQTAGGQSILAAVQYPFQKLAQFGDYAGDAINQPTSGQPRIRGPQQKEAMAAWEAAGRPSAPADPLMATAVNTAIQAAPSLLLKGPKGAGRVATTVAEAPKPTVPGIAPRQALVKELVDKGLKVTPVSAGAKAGAIAEGLSGAAKLERAISLKNAKRVNELVGEDVGLKGAKEITQGDINRLYVEANKPYAEIAKTGVRKVSSEFRQEIANIVDRSGGESFKADVPKDITRLKGIYGNLKQFTAQDAVSKIRQLRADASKNIKAPNAPEQNAKGYVQRAIADALDNELTRHVESLGKPELATNYKAARVQLAKIHTLEDALDGSNVSASALAKAKDRGAPLTGNMDLVARAATEFDRSFQNVSKIRDGSPFSVLDLGAGVVGASASPALTAAVLARPATRAILSSERYQRSLAKGQKAQPETPAKAPSSEVIKKAFLTAPDRKERKK